MKKFLSLIAFITFTSVAFVSCKDDDEDTTPTPTAPTSGDVVIDITNVAGTQNVDVTGGTNYTNSFGEVFSVTKLKYYISNVQLLNNGVVTYTMPESYFLVDELLPATKLLTLPDVPAGNYTSVRFLIGVDSAKTVSGVQTGALDQANGMFWTWNTGYIAFKLEGFSSSSPLTDTSITYHIGGYLESLNQNTLRTVNLNFGGAELNVDGVKEAEIHLFADILNVFDAVHSIQISSNPDITMPGADAIKVAVNYATMFTFNHLHN